MATPPGGAWSADGPVAERLFRHGGAVLGACLAVALALGLAAALTLRIDNSTDVWLPGDDPELARYDEFKTRFGEDDVFALATAPVDAADPGTATRLVRFVEELRGVDGVARVRTPFAAVDGPEAGLRLADDPLSRTLRGADDRRFALLVQPDPRAAPLERMGVLDEVEALARRFEPELGPFGLVGTDVVTRDLDRGSARWFGGLFPLVAAVLAGVLVLSLRSVRMTAAILLAAGAAAACTMGTLGLAGRSVNVVVVVVPAILVVLTVAASMHLAARFLSFPEADRPLGPAERAALWKRAWAATLPPCALTALTTVLGFASLGLSPIGPVRDLGIFTAVGTLWVFLFVFTAVPLLLVRSAAVVPHPRPARVLTRPRVERFVARLRRWRTPVLLAGLAFVVVGATGLQRLRVESHVLRFFPDAHPLPQDFRDFEASFFGLTCFEAWVEGPRASLASEDTFVALDRLRDAALGEGLVTDVLSPLEVLGDGLPAAARALLLGTLFPRAAPGTTLADYVWAEDDRAALRLTFAAPTTSSDAANDTARVLRDEVRRLGASLPDGVEVRISGSAPLLVRGQVLLLQTQVRSFLVALAVISAVILVAYRSLRLTWISVVPNVLPILGTLGLMGWLGIALDAGTATIAGIALGLVIDDTIHLLHHYVTHPVEGDAGPNARVVETLVTVGRPVIVTSVVVAVGFGVFAAAEFRPTRYFGLLIAVTSGFALLCDTVLLPAVLLGRRARPFIVHEVPGRTSTSR